MELFATEYLVNSFLYTMSKEKLLNLSIENSPNITTSLAYILIGAKQCK